MLRFNEGGPEAPKTRKAPDKTLILSDEQRGTLAEAVEAGLRPYLDGVVRWRLVDLAHWLYREFSVSVSPDTAGRELRAMGYVIWEADRSPLGVCKQTPVGQRPAALRSG